MCPEVVVLADAALHQPSTPNSCILSAQHVSEIANPCTKELTDSTRSRSDPINSYDGEVKGLIIRRREAKVATASPSISVRTAEQELLCGRALFVKLLLVPGLAEESVSV